MGTTDDDLRQHGAPPLARLPVQAAKDRRSAACGEAMQRLRPEIGFGNPFPSGTGIAAGEIMKRIHRANPVCPPPAVLPVGRNDRLPVSGAGGFMAEHLNQHEPAEPGFRKGNPENWRSACERTAKDVHDFGDRDRACEAASGRRPDAASRSGGAERTDIRNPEDRRLHDSAQSGGVERDGIRHGRMGEGPNRKALRHWVRAIPDRVCPAFSEFRACTEIILDSADGVDVVHRGPDAIAVLEVKPIDSNETDPGRGVLQCIKYRAVMEAMGTNGSAARHPNRQVIPVPVTRSPLPDDLADLTKGHGIRHFRAPREVKRHPGARQPSPVSPCRRRS